MSRRVVMNEDPGTRTVWRDAYGKIRGSRRYVDDVPMVEYYDTDRRELIVYDDRRQAINGDVPDNLAFVDMGLTGELNGLLDRKGPNEARRMDAADFRERCVVYGNAVYALHEKRSVDFQPPWFKRPERIAEMLGVPFDLAKKLTDLLGTDRQDKIDRAFGFNASMANRLFHSYTTAEGEGRGGLMSLAGNVEAIAEIVEMLERLNAECNEPVEEEQIETVHGYDVDGWALGYEVLYDATGWYDNDPADDDEKEWDDGLDQTGPSELYGAHRLYTDRDGVDYKLIDEIKSAGIAEIGKIQQRMFAQENAWTGMVYKAEYDWMTPAQKSIVWSFIKAQKTKLAKAGLKQLGRRGREVLGLVRQLGRCPQSRALITAWSVAGEFDMAGDQWIFEQKPSAEAVYAMWAVYRRL